LNTLKALNPDIFIRIVKKRNEEPRAAVTVKVCDVLEAAMIELVLAVLGVMAVIMLIGWTVQRGAGNGGWTDVFWTYGTGATCALASLTPIGAQPGVGWRRALVAVMAAAWALRLGGYIAVRVARSREDARYTELRGEHRNADKRGDRRLGDQEGEHVTLELRATPSFAASGARSSSVTCSPS
jgi:hypothetical protein